MLNSFQATMVDLAQQEALSFTKVRELHFTEKYDYQISEMIPSFQSYGHSVAFIGVSIETMDEMVERETSEHLPDFLRLYGLQMRPLSSSPPHFEMPFDFSSNGNFGTLSLSGGSVYRSSQEDFREYSEKSHFENLRDFPFILKGQDIENILKFRDLHKKWSTECAFSYSAADIVMSESYQRIIGMGKSALPLIFGQLKKEKDKPDHWFWALRSITGENPVSQETNGIRKQMAKIWLRWAEMNGYEV